MDKKTPSVKLNMLMNAILTASSIVFPLITLPYITRVLGPQYLGKVYFSHSVVMMFSMIAELGIPVYGIKACAKVRENIIELSRTVHEILAINLVSCAVSYVLLTVTIVMVPGVRAEKTLIIAMSAVIILNSLGMEWLYKAIEKYTYITVRSLIFKTIALAAMFMLVKSKDDYIIYGVLTIAAASASNILNMINARRYVMLKPVGGYDPWRHIRGMMFLFMLAAAVNIYTSLDVALLDLLSGDAQAGLYGVSARIKAALVSMITSVSAVLLPRTAFYFEKGETDSFSRLIGGTLRLVVTAAVLTAVYFAVFAGDIIGVLAGDGFAGAAGSLRILMPALVLIVVSNVIGMQMLVPMDREKPVAAAAAAGAVIDLLLNLIMIPKFGPEGAAAATLAAEAAVLVCLVHAAGVKRIKKLVTDIPLIMIAAAGAAGAVSGTLAASGMGSPVLSLLASGACYCVTCGIIFFIYERSCRQKERL